MKIVDELVDFTYFKLSKILNPNPPIAMISIKGFNVLGLMILCLSII